MTTDSPPNILVIMSDQHHPRFLGCAGSPILQTPHLDALAARGARFAHAYCNFPLCGPSRMSFLTSRYPSEIRTLSNASQLGSEVPTFAHAFGEAGYDTILCGRMHFNGPDQRHGFQQRIAGDVLGANKNPQAAIDQVLGPVLSRQTGPQASAISTSGPGLSGYQSYDETVTDRASAWLRDRRPQIDAPPFLLVVGLVLPHAPFVARPEDYALYDEQISLKDLPEPHPGSLHPALKKFQQRAGLEDAPPVPREDQRRARVAYHGLCSHVDRLVGRLLQALDDSGQSENTIVVYTSDHGEQLGEHGMWWKHSFYEASIGVPLIMAGPGIPSGVIREQNVSLLDLGPTLLELAGAPAIPGASGKSFHNLLRPKPGPWRDRVWAENLWPGSASTIQRMIKEGPWKLCHYPPQRPQLFNLQKDPTEEHDLADDPAFREKLDALMSRLLENWDHDALMAQRAQDAVSEKWAQRSWTRCNQPDPDPFWCDEAQRNEFT